MLGFLFTEDDALVLDEKSVAKLKENAPEVLDATIHYIENYDGPFTTEALEHALRELIVEGMDIKPRVAFGPIRVAVTGRQVSPPLFESMEILGRESVLNRLHALRNQLG